jgi:hypothetical protein
MNLEERANEFIDRYALGNTACADLLDLLRSYGAERARAERTGTIELIESKITELAADGSEYHYALCWHFRCFADLLRALP